MNDDIVNQLDEVADISNDMRDCMRFDNDDWRTLPKELQDAINEAAKALEKLEEVIAQHTSNK